MMTELSQKLDALKIILSCPLWPPRESLGLSGRELYDAILGDAREYAFAIAKIDFETALRISGHWAVLANRFIDAQKINDAENGGNNLKLLGVFKHYLDAMGVEFMNIKASA